MRPWLIGHRGAPALAPENTLASIATALELGVEEGANTGTDTRTMQGGGRWVRALDATTRRNR